MSDGPDEFDIFHLGQEDVQEIIDWAAGAAAMVLLMENAPEHTHTEEAIDRLDGYIQAVSIMVENMPQCLVGPATSIADTAVEAAVFEEEQVEQFREQLKEL